MSFADDFQILNSEIDANGANGDYGGVCVQFATNVVIRNSSVSSNKAEGLLAVNFLEVDLIGSGGLGITESEHVLIDSCVLHANRAYHYGGGLFVTYSNDVTIRDSSLVNNSAHSGGGVNLYRNRIIRLSSVLLQGNAAERNGGGMLVDQVDSLAVTASSLRRNRAEAGFGSAMWILKSTANITGNTFDDNAALLG